MHQSNPVRACLEQCLWQILVPIAACLLLGAAGCSDSPREGNGGGTIDRPDPPNRATVTVVARDPFGASVPGADIVLLSSSGTGSLEIGIPTDADGRVEIEGIFSDAYAALVTTAELRGISYEPIRPADDRIAFEVILHPLSDLTPGLGRLSVAGASADGRQLEFSARLHVVEGNAFDTLEDWNLADVDVLPCDPDIDNDTTTFTADCIEGSAGFDAPYAGTTLAQRWIDPEPASAPLAIALLLDQGASLAAADPEDRRLLAARYFQTQLDADDQMLLAAFAADNVDTGEVALLPDQPATIFPVDDPAFTSDGSSYLPVIDSLATLEGGASPLFAAVGELIGFTADAAPVNSRRAVVVLTSSDVTDCGTPAECQAVHDSLREQSASADVSVVIVELSDSSRQTDRKKLGTLAQSGHGAIFWAQDPMQLPTTVGRITEILSGGHGAVDVTIRLESPVVGAFASGRTVVGTLRVVICPWDCDSSIDVPFVLRVP